MLSASVVSLRCLRRISACFAMTARSDFLQITARLLEQYGPMTYELYASTCRCWYSAGTPSSAGLHLGPGQRLL